ncbi:cytochrome P450 [Kutzneria albida]|uniref:Cytochrome P450 105A3 n=1 Tax=Kutzneria albida DSM 43870 TaxID=1449976 RepID=W5W0Z2_9PSEU|nr:cytochrome P450 [Kutzneria albida]AHH94848.1 Cytochrome P450 105A3 [Kutzneria albida DSM 43870]
MTNAEAPAFPMRRACPYSEPAEYAKLRTDQPVSQVTLATGRRAWIVARYEDVRKLLLDPRVSSDQAKPGFPHHVHIPEEMLAHLSIPLAGMDAPVHTAQRRMVLPEFTVARMRALRPRIQELVDELVDAMLAGERPVDLVRALATPVPSQVICEMLGVPYADRHIFETVTELILDHNTAPQDRAAADGQLVAHLDKLVTAAEADPGDNLLGRMIVKNRETPVFDHAGMVGLIRILLIAGHETTANMVSLSVFALLDRPDLLAQLREDPDLTPKAVEELMRFFSISDHVTCRVATEDLEIDGVLIRAGEGVIALNGSANHDESVFTDPDEVDFHREARHHVAFGYGIHQCIGQNLARLELEIVLNTLIARLPGLRFAVPPEELSFKYDGVIYGMHSLPVTW